MKDMGRLVENVSSTYAEVCSSMILCTVIAHERAMEINQISPVVMAHMSDWLGEYMDRFEVNPITDIDKFLHRAVLEVRDAVEAELGVAKTGRRMESGS